jgi:hypothetical protein
MSKRKTAAAAVTTPEVVSVPEAVSTGLPVDEAVPVTTPEVTPAAEGKRKISRAELREQGVGRVFDDLEVARANKPTNEIAAGSEYVLWTVVNGTTYYVWSIDQRRALEFVARHVGFTAERTDKPARTSQVNALRDENADLKAQLEALKAEMAARNGSV